MEKEQEQRRDEGKEKKPRAKYGGPKRADKSASRTCVCKRACAYYVCDICTHTHTRDIYTGIHTRARAAPHRLFIFTSVRAYSGLPDTRARAQSHVRGR